MGLESFQVHSLLGPLTAPGVGQALVVRETLMPLRADGFPQDPIRLPAKLCPSGLVPSPLHTQAED